MPPLTGILSILSLVWKINSFIEMESYIFGGAASYKDVETIVISSLKILRFSDT